MEESIICIYHKNCTDGTTSASILLSKYPDCKLFPLEHRYKTEDFEKILENINQNTIVYIVDFSLPKEDTEKILKKAKKIINIDHHIGVNEILKQIASKYDNFEYVFNNNMSGASLTWKYLYGEPIPELVKLVEDKDIWTWKYKEKTKYANAYLFMLTNKPEEVKELLNKDLSEILKLGEVISKYTDYIIDTFVEKAKPTCIKIDNYLVKSFNTNLFQSEIGNILSSKLNEPVALFSINGDNVKISFRSCEGQSPTALELAKKLGGGGHKHASGAGLSLYDFCNMIQIGGNGQ